MSVIVNKVIWGWPLLILFIYTGLYLSFKLKFAHFGYIAKIKKVLTSQGKDENSPSVFSTTMLLIGSHVGVGNLVGVSLAIFYGGPGAIFWMWVSTLIIVVLSFFENTLGQLYKQKIGNEYKGGPAYYILHGLGSKFYSKLTAFLLFLSIGLFMPMVQTSAIITAVSSNFSLTTYHTGIILSFLMALILFGNHKKILRTVNVMVPFMTFMYVLIAIIIIYMNFQYVGDVFSLIITSALNRQSYYGGVIFTAFSFGLRRGVFSNEAGVGVAPNISSLGHVNHPISQGIISSFCVLIDTLGFCTLTALIILLPGKYNVMLNDVYLYKNVDVTYEFFLVESFNTVLLGRGVMIFTLFIFFFAFTSLISCYVNATANLMFISKNPLLAKQMLFVYKVVFIVCIYINYRINSERVWLLADMGVGIVAYINIITIILLKNKVFEALLDYKIRIE